MWPSMEKCWVPNCPNSRDHGYKKNFFPLPTSARYKEIWLSLAGKKSSGMENLIYFCQDHFDPNVVEIYMNKFVCLNATATPYFNMPERICCTCRSIIKDGDLFSVLSAKVPCTIPMDIKSEVLTCRPEPLLQVLNFCIPELNLTHDPLPLACYKCYHNIWLFYIFKLTCNAVEKGSLSSMTPAVYGKLVYCRACPTSSGNSFYVLKEESPLGKLLKKMFLTNHPVEVIPLKVCLDCWTILCKLEKFFQQCLAVEQKMQRHLAYSEYTVNSLPAPSTSLTMPQSNPRPSHLGEYWNTGHPFLVPAPQRPMPTSSTETSNRVNSDVPSTSVIKYCDKQEAGYSQKPPDNEPHSNLKFKMKSDMIERINKSEGSTEYNNAPSTSINDVTKADMSDDDAELESKEKDPTTSQRLTPMEKIALAELMLKHGAPLKADVSPKVHFEAWVSIVREFHQMGYERPLEVIQQSWKGMKKKAEAACETVGPASHVNRLVIDYLKDDSLVTRQQSKSVIQIQINKNDGCDIICIDDEVRNETKEGKKIKVTKTVQIGEAVKTVVEPTRSDNKAEEESKPQHQKVKKEIKPEVSRYLTRDHWTQKRQLALVRKMRKQYDLCLKNSELPTRKMPWRMILERLVETEYQNYTVDQLYYQWGKMKVSATVNDKNGLDLVGEEVWDMLQMQNAVQKSIDANETISKSHIVEKDARLEESGGPCTRQQDSRKNHSEAAKAAVEPIPSNKEAEVESQPRKKMKREKKQEEPKSLTRDYWNHERKLELVRKMRKQYDHCSNNSQLPIRKSPWKMILERLLETEYKNSTFDKLYAQWSKMKMSATIHEKDGLDLVDVEVWDMLQLQNSRVQKSIAGEEATSGSSSVEKDANLGESRSPSAGRQENSRKNHRNSPLAVKNEEKKKDNSSKSTDKQRANNKIDRNSSLTEKNEDKKKDNSVKSTDRRKANNKIDSNSPLPSKKRKSKPEERDEPFTSSKTKPWKQKNFDWSEDEKLELVKLIKGELVAMLKEGEPICGKLWRKIIARLIEKGYKRNPSYTYFGWRCIRKIAKEHQSTGKMTFLDQKVLRLLGLYNRAMSRKQPAQKKKKTDSEAKKADSEATKVEKASVDKEQPQSGQERSKPSLAQAKIDLINIIKSYGDGVFRVMKNRGVFWPKVVADFNAKGYKWDMPRIRSCWSNCLISAKQAWAYQKEANELDKIIIDFMTEVIMEKDKNSGGDDRVESDMEEKVEDDKKGDEDDHFDEISERKSDASNRSPGSEDNAATELDYDYVSLEDIEKGFSVDNEENKGTEGVALKTEPQEEGLPFKIESYTSEQVIEILDSDEG